MPHAVARHFSVAHRRDWGSRHGDADVTAESNAAIRSGDRDIVGAITRALANILGANRRDSERGERDNANKAPRKTDGL